MVYHAVSVYIYTIVLPYDGTVFILDVWLCSYSSVFVVVVVVVLFCFLNVQVWPAEHEYRSSYAGVFELGQ